MLFISYEKLFSSFRYLHFGSDYLVYVQKRLDEKAKFSFKICDITDWTANIINIKIFLYLKE